MIFTFSNIEFVRLGVALSRKSRCRLTYVPSLVRVCLESAVSYRFKGSFPLNKNQQHQLAASPLAIYTNVGNR